MKRDSIQQEFKRVLDLCLEYKSKGFKIVEFELQFDIAGNVRNMLYNETHEYGMLNGFAFIDFPYTINGERFDRMSQDVEHNGERYKKYILKYLK